MTEMADLKGLFNSPPRSPPPRSPAQLSPSPSPARPVNENPLFFSPGAASQTDSPSRARRGRERSESPSAHREEYAVRRVEATREEEGGIVRIRRAYNVVPAAPKNTSSGSSSVPYVPGANTFANRGTGGTSTGMEDAGGSGADEGEGEDGQTKKRVIAKVDVDRLLGDKGLPLLCKAAKNFKMRGEGREAEDLRNLLNMYQMWAHGMYPKGDFVHTMNRTETICRTRRMESAISGLRDAYHYRSRSPPVPRFTASPRRSISPSESFREPSGRPMSPPIDRPSVEEDAHLREEEPLFEEPDWDEIAAMEAEKEFENAGTGLHDIGDDGEAEKEEERRREDEKLMAEMEELYS